MRLNLKDILFVPGASRSFSFSLDLSELDFNGVHIIDRPVQISGAVQNVAGALVLKGEAATTLDLVCDRCLKEYSQSIRLPVENLLAESLEDEENDEIVLLENGEVDLDSLFTTALVLSMDSKHVCSETCKGLCPGCGVNLNEGPCRCKKEVDPRLAVLAQLLDDKSQ